MRVGASVDYCNASRLQRHFRTATGGDSEQRELGADSFDGGVLGAEQGCDERVERGSSANFVVDMRGRATNFSVGREFAGQALAKNEKFDRLSHRDFAVVKRDRFFSPRKIKLRLNTFERNLVVKLEEALFVQFDAVAIVADEEFIQFFGRCAGHGL